MTSDHLSFGANVSGLTHSICESVIRRLARVRVVLFIKSRRLDEQAGPHWPTPEMTFAKAIELVAKGEKACYFRVCQVEIAATCYETCFWPVI